MNTSTKSTVLIAAVCAAGLWTWVHIGAQRRIEQNNAVGGASNPEGYSSTTNPGSHPSGQSIPLPIHEGTQPKPQSSEITVAVEALLANRVSYPSVALLERFSSKEEENLIELYNLQSELTNRLALTWILAGIGGDHAASVFKSTVIGRYENRVMSLKERELMRDTVLALGFIAVRSDTAYDFLLASSSPAFWATNRSWVVGDPQEEAYTNIRFAGQANKALAASLRPGAYEKLLELRDAMPTPASKMPGAVVDGAFFYHYASENGSGGLLKLLLSRGTYEEFNKWRQTEEGMRWKSWSTELKQSHTPQYERFRH